MKSIIILLIVLLFTSCLTVKRIEKNCDKFAAVCITSTNVKTEYRDTTIYRDRIVQVVLPKDTVKITDTLFIRDNKCFLPYVYRTFGNVWASAKVDNSILDLKAGYVSNNIQVPIRDTIYIEKGVTSTTTDNTVILPPEKIIPGWYRFTNKWFIASLVLISIFITWKIKGAWIKSLLNKK